jgi:hypothetical protein
MQDAFVSPDWTAVQMQFILRAAQRSMRAQDLSYAVLRKVAAGALSPADIHAALTGIATAHSASYNAQLSQLGMRFFSEVLQILGDASDAPPHLNAGDPAAWFVALAEYVNANSRRALLARQIDLERLASGQVTADAVHGSIAMESARTTDRLRRIAMLYFEWLRDVSELSETVEHDCFSRLLRPAADGAPRLELTGAPGEAPATLVTIENSRSEPTAIRALVSDLRRADGSGPAFTPVTVLDPDDVVLEAGAEARLRIVLHLEPGRFLPGVTYVGGVQVLHHDGERLDIPLYVTVTHAMDRAPHGDAPLASTIQREWTGAGQR